MMLKVILFCRYSVMFRKRVAHKVQRHSAGPPPRCRSHTYAQVLCLCWSERRVKTSERENDLMLQTAGGTGRNRHAQPSW